MPDLSAFDPVTLFKPILDNTNDLVVITTADDLDAGGPTILYVNPAFTRVTGYTAEEAIGQTPGILRGPDTDPQTSARIRIALEAGEPIHTEIQNYAKDGSTYWIDLNIVPLRGEDGQIRHFAAIQRDVTGWKNLEAELKRQAATDALTGLANRRAFFEAVDTEAARVERYGGDVSVVMLDLDHFKRINDAFGHAAGDVALARFAEICRHHARAVDLAARVGGEEFALLLPATTAAGAARLAERIGAAVRGLTVLADGHSFAFTVSIGVAGYRRGRDSVATLMQRADAALYRAKEAGRDRVCQGDDEDGEEASAMADEAAAPARRHG